MLSITFFARRAFSRAGASGSSIPRGLAHHATRFERAAHGHLQVRIAPRSPPERDASPSPARSPPAFVFPRPPVQMLAPLFQIRGREI